MAKAKVSTDEKWEKQDFDLFQAIEAIDKKNYDWFSQLSEEQQRKFVPYMMLHWISTVKGSNQLVQYYLLSTESYANKHMFNEVIQKHPELQWLMLCASSPGIGKQFHQWLPHLSAKIGNLKEAAKLKDVSDYLEKVFTKADKSSVKEYATAFTTQQNHKHRIAKLFPDSKLEDVEVLSTLLTSDDLDKYDEYCGND